MTYSALNRTVHSKSFSGQLLNEVRELFIAGDYKSAEPLLLQPSLQNANNPEVFQMLATIHYSRAQFSKSIKLFKKALEIDPAYTDAAVGLSIILNDLGRYDEAKSVFEQAQSQVDHAKTALAKVSSNDEVFAEKHAELADMYLNARRFQEALEQYGKALNLSVNKIDVHMQISECYLQAGHKDKAIRELKTLLQSNQRLVQPRLKLGLILYNSHMIAEAVDQWENVLRFEPKNPDAVRYLKMAQTAGITNINL